MNDASVARILLCEDSPTYARALTDFLQRDEDLRVVGTCRSAEQLSGAIALLKPDLLAIDLELPGMNGIDATHRIMAGAPLPILVLTGRGPRGSERAVAALAAGALEAISKTELAVTGPDTAWSIAMRRHVKRLARTRMKPHSRAVASNGHGSALAGRTARAVGICSSTGGPHALELLLGAVPGDFPVPLLVVQHISPGFLGNLVRWLAREVALPVRVAVDGSRLERGVTFASERAHLTLVRDRLRFDHTTDCGRHRPAGDVLLGSLAAELGAQAGAVVLTGMGEDGACGLGEVAAAGGITLAQDEESSVVYGMPRAAAEHGAQIVASPRDIGTALAALRIGGASMIACIEQVAELIRRETGMALGPSRMPALAAAVQRVAPGLDGASVAREAVRDRRSSGMLARLIDEVAVNETFFFRHRQELDAIDWVALARSAAVDGRRHVRVWSAACATGEEAYTLAMMACQGLHGASTGVSVLASDISGRALDRARAGIYTKRSVRLMPAELRARHLVELGEGHGVRPELRALVRFRHHNLVSDSSPPPGERAFDLVVCRNVLIYFEPQVALEVLASLRGALAPGGTLLLGTADRLCDAAGTPAHRPVRERRRSASPRTSRAHVGMDPVRQAPPPSLAGALKAADAGRLDEALELTADVVAADPLHADAHYVQGVVELARGETAAAVTALRRALYLDPQFTLAAFQLARAHDTLSQGESARRGYARALRLLEQGPADRPGGIGGLNAARLAVPCRARLRALTPAGAGDLERPT